MFSSPRFRRLTTILFLSVSCTALTIGASVTALAGGSNGGGGDEVGIEFAQLAIEAIQELRSSNGGLTQGLDLEALEKAARGSKVVVVDAELPVRLGPLTQDSVAINDPHANTVQVQRERWLGIGDIRVRKATALHEILSLVGAESTGDYHISSRYLSLLGYACAQPGICNGAPEPAQGTREKMEQAFASASAPTEGELAGDWTKISEADAPMADSFFGKPGFDLTGMKWLTTLQFQPESDMLGNSPLMVRRTFDLCPFNFFDHDHNQNPAYCWLREAPLKLTTTSGGACFAQWNYRQGSSLDVGNMYYAYECRLIKQADTLLCSLTPHQTWKDKDSALFAKYEGKTLSYELYKRNVRK